MGCDIHLVIEYSEFEKSDGTPWWSGFGGEFNPGRDYHMFSIMAGVRAEGGDEQLFQPRHLPEGDHSWQTRQMLGHEDDEGNWVEDSDLHSLSWLTGDEYAQCYANRMLNNEYGPPALSYEIILIVLNEFKEHGQSARVIFAFDN